MEKPPTGWKRHKAMAAVVQPCSLPRRLAHPCYDISPKRGTGLVISASGQSRRFDCAPTTSALPPSTDIVRSPPAGPFRDDIVAKVENRATRKISRKLIFGLLRRCVAFQGHDGGPWSIWMKRCGLSRRGSQNASAALKNFVCPPKKTFAPITEVWTIATLYHRRR